MAELDIVDLSTPEPLPARVVAEVRITVERDGLDCVWRLVAVDEKGVESRIVSPPIHSPEAAAQALRAAMSYFLEGYGTKETGFSSTSIPILDPNWRA